MGILGFFRPPHVLGLEAKRDVKGLIAALGCRAGSRNENAARVRCRAAEALGRIGGPAAVEPLIAALRNETTRVRCSAAWALGIVGDPRAIEPLEAALTGATLHRLVSVSGDTVAWWAARALLKLDEPRGMQRLEALLRTEQLRGRSVDASLTELLAQSLDGARALGLAGSPLQCEEEREHQKAMRVTEMLRMRDG